MKSKYLPQEFKVICVRECVVTELIVSPEQAVKYWRDNIPQAPWFDPMKEAFVILVLNTRKRILGHNLVALGGLDTCFVSPLQVFRPAIACAAASIILAHNLCVAAHKLCYVTLRFMCSWRLAVLAITRVRWGKECYA